MASDKLKRHFVTSNTSYQNKDIAVLKKTKILEKVQMLDGKKV